jgi:DNA-binding CsgD family transcriptional regulator
MDGGSGPWKRDLVRLADDHLTAMTALLAAVDAQAGVPDETRRSLHQMAEHVKALADTCHWLASEVGVPGGGRSSVAPRGTTPTQQLAAKLAGAELAVAREADGLDRAALDPELAAQLLERVRPSGTPRPEQLAKLTPQERRIFELIGQGCTNRQIATRLFLAEKTVKNYVSNMLRKLGMERRTQAAVFATYLDRPRLVDAPGTSRPA